VQITCTQGGKPKKITLQGVNKKIKQGEKQNLHTLQGGINLFTHLFSLILQNRSLFGCLQLEVI
jgi:hypothetical protein